MGGFLSKELNFGVTASPVDPKHATIRIDEESVDSSETLYKVYAELCRVYFKELLRRETMYQQKAVNDIGGRSSSQVDSPLLREPKDMGTSSSPQQEPCNMMNDKASSIRSVPSYRGSPSSVRRTQQSEKDEEENPPVPFPETVMLKTLLHTAVRFDSLLSLKGLRDVLGGNENAACQLNRRNGQPPGTCSPGLRDTMDPAVTALRLKLEDCFDVYDETFALASKEPLGSDVQDEYVPIDEEAEGFFKPLLGSRSYVLHDFSCSSVSGGHRLGLDGTLFSKLNDEARLLPRKKTTMASDTLAEEERRATADILRPRSVVVLRTLEDVIRHLSLLSLLVLRELGDSCVQASSSFGDLSEDEEEGSIEKAIKRIRSGEDLNWFAVFGENYLASAGNPDSIVFHTETEFDTVARQFAKVESTSNASALYDVIVWELRSILNAVIRAHTLAFPNECEVISSLPSTSSSVDATPIRTHLSPAQLFDNAISQLLHGVRSAVANESVQPIGSTVSSLFKVQFQNNYDALKCLLSAPFTTHRSHQNEGPTATPPSGARRASTESSTHTGRRRSSSTASPLLDVTVQGYSSKRSPSSLSSKKISRMASTVLGVEALGSINHERVSSTGGGGGGAVSPLEMPDLFASTMRDEDKKRQQEEFDRKKQLAYYSSETPTHRKTTTQLAKSVIDRSKLTPHSEEGDPSEIIKAMRSKLFTPAKPSSPVVANSIGTHHHRPSSSAQQRKSTIGLEELDKKPAYLSSHTAYHVSEFEKGLQEETRQIIGEIAEEGDWDLLSIDQQAESKRQALLAEKEARRQQHLIECGEDADEEAISQFKRDGTAASRYHGLLPVAFWNAGGKKPFGNTVKLAIEVAKAEQSPKLLADASHQHLALQVAFFLVIEDFQALLNRNKASCDLMEETRSEATALVSGRELKFFENRVLQGLPDSVKLTKVEVERWANVSHVLTGTWRKKICASGGVLYDELLAAVVAFDTSHVLESKEPLEHHYAVIDPFERLRTAEHDPRVKENDPRSPYYNPSAQTGSKRPMLSGVCIIHPSSTDKNHYGRVLLPDPRFTHQQKKNSSGTSSPPSPHVMSNSAMEDFVFQSMSNQLSAPQSTILWYTDIRVLWRETLAEISGVKTHLDEFYDALSTKRPSSPTSALVRTDHQSVAAATRPPPEEEGEGKQAEKITPQKPNLQPKRKKRNRGKSGGCAPRELPSREEWERKKLTFIASIENEKVEALQKRDVRKQEIANLRRLQRNPTCHDQVALGTEDELTEFIEQYESQNADLDYKWLFDETNNPVSWSSSNVAERLEKHRVDVRIAQMPKPPPRVSTLMNNTKCTRVQETKRYERCVIQRPMSSLNAPTPASLDFGKMVPEDFVSAAAFHYSPTYRGRNQRTPSIQKQTSGLELPLPGSPTTPGTSSFSSVEETIDADKFAIPFPSQPMRVLFGLDDTGSVAAAGSALDAIAPSELTDRSMHHDSEDDGITLLWKLVHSSIKRGDTNLPTTLKFTDADDFVEFTLLVGKLRPQQTETTRTHRKSSVMTVDSMCDSHDEGESLEKQLSVFEVVRTTKSDHIVIPASWVEALTLPTTSSQVNFTLSSLLEVDLLHRSTIRRLLAFGITEKLLGVLSFASSGLQVFIRTKAARVLAIILNNKLIVEGLVLGENEYRETSGVPTTKTGKDATTTSDRSSPVQQMNLLQVVSKELTWLLQLTVWKRQDTAYFISLCAILLGVITMSERATKILRTDFKNILFKVKRVLSYVIDESDKLHVLFMGETDYAKHRVIVAACSVLFMGAVRRANNYEVVRKVPRPLKIENLANEAVRVLTLLVAPRQSTGTEGHGLQGVGTRAEQDGSSRTAMGRSIFGRTMSTAGMSVVGSRPRSPKGGAHSDSDSEASQQAALHLLSLIILSFEFLERSFWESLWKSCLTIVANLTGSGARGASGGNDNSVSPQRSASLSRRSSSGRSGSVSPFRRHPKVQAGNTPVPLKLSSSSPTKVTIDLLHATCMCVAKLIRAAAREITTMTSSQKEPNVYATTVVSQCGALVPALLPLLRHLLSKIAPSRDFTVDDAATHEKEGTTRVGLVSLAMPPNKRPSTTINESLKRLLVPLETPSIPQDIAHRNYMFGKTGNSPKPNEPDEQQLQHADTVSEHSSSHYTATTARTQRGLSSMTEGVSSVGTVESTRLDMDCTYRVLLAPYRLSIDCTLGVLTAMEAVVAARDGGVTASCKDIPDPFASTLLQTTKCDSILFPSLVALGLPIQNEPPRGEQRAAMCPVYSCLVNGIRSKSAEILCIMARSSVIVSIIEPEGAIEVLAQCLETSPSHAVAVAAGRVLTEMCRHKYLLKDSRVSSLLSGLLVRSSVELRAVGVRSLANLAREEETALQVSQIVVPHLSSLIHILGNDEPATDIHARSEVAEICRLLTRVSIVDATKKVIRESGAMKAAVTALGHNRTDRKIVRGCFSVIEILCADLQEEIERISLECRDVLDSLSRFFSSTDKDSVLDLIISLKLITTLEQSKIACDRFIENGLPEYLMLSFKHPVEVVQDLSSAAMILLRYHIHSPKGEATAGHHIEPPMVVKSSIPPTSLVAKKHQQILTAAYD